MKLVEVRFAELDLDEAWPCLGGDVVTDAQACVHDFAGGQQGRRIDGQQAQPVERDGPLEDPRHVPGQAMRVGGPVQEPDDVVAGAGLVTAATFPQRLTGSEGSHRRNKSPEIWDGCGRR